MSRSEVDESLAGSQVQGTKLPPVTQIGVVAMALVVIGGIYMSAYYPNRVSMGLPATLSIVSILLICVNFFLVARSTVLAKAPFIKVGKWALLVYVIIAGMLEYVFVYDGTRGSSLVVLTLMLLVFALDVPTIVAFTVARFNS